REPTAPAGGAACTQVDSTGSTASADLAVAGSADSMVEAGSVDSTAAAGGASVHESPTSLPSDVGLSWTLAPPAAAVESTEPASTMESAEPATAKSAEAVEPVESTRVHAAPPAGAVGSRRPAAKAPTRRAAKVPTMSA